jgi:hypothetical protein
MGILSLNFIRKGQLYKYKVLHTGGLFIDILFFEENDDVISWNNIA